MEVWKDINGYEGDYKVSNTGKVFSIKSGKELKIRKQSNGKYFCVILCRHGFLKMHRVHRLVALSFIPNPDNKRQVNHKDCNSLNNNADNLEWATASENLKHAFKYGRLKPPKPFLGKFGKEHNRSKGFWIRDSAGIGYYNSGLEFYRKTGLDHTCISYGRKYIVDKNCDKYVFKKGAMKNLILYLEYPINPKR